MRLDKRKLDRRTNTPPFPSAASSPLADGRVRSDVPFANYAFYRQLLEEVILARPKGF